MAQRNVKVGEIKDVRGEVNIAAGDISIYKGYTADQVSVLLTQITSTFQPKPFDGRCPYKGLDVFEEEDAELFFGREMLVGDLVRRVKDSRTVFVTGPSGSGKSSLVRAGLIHALKQGVIKNLHSERWLYETMKPGREPLKDLALAFSRLKSPELANYFRTHANETNVLDECAESVLSARKDQRFILFVDQFEEVFTQINREADRVAFINMLAHAATVENGRVIVLFAMRSDFVSNCATYPTLNQLLNQEFHQIGAMQPEELVSAIALPAKQVGLPIEDELIARIINDMNGEPGALPLMQFALKDLFDSQQGKSGLVALTLADYLRHGGVARSLEHHADDSLAQLNSNEQQLARSIFSGLIEIGHGTADTRRTALFDELIPANTKAEEVLVVVQKLADARLITTDEVSGKDTVTISHEKLIDAWPWLKKLVNENRDVIALQNEIAADAKEWDEHKRDASYVYSGARLANANEKLKSKELALSGTAFEYIRAGRARQQRGRVFLFSGISLLLIISIVAALVFRNQAEEAQGLTTIALARQLAAQAQSIIATRNSKQMLGVLLAVQSMNMFPSSEAAQILLNNNFTVRPAARFKHDSHVNSIAFSSDGKYIASGSDDNTARVWEITTGKEIARVAHDGRMAHDGNVVSVAFSPDGKYLATESRDGIIRVWETTTGKEIIRKTHVSIANTVAFSPDGKYIASGNDDSTVSVWEATTGKEILKISTDHNVAKIIFSPDGKYLLSGDYTTRVWEVVTGKEIAHMDPGGISAVAFSPDGNYVALGSNDNTARVWETATGKEVARMLHENAVISIAFSSEGKYVVSGSLDTTARVWEAASGREIARMTHDGTANSVAFSPNGKYVISGSSDNTARVWEATSGREIARMTHDSFVNCVAFSPDGKYAASGGYDNTINIWEVSADKEIVRTSHNDLITAVTFSPNGNYVVSGSTDGTVRFWDIRTGNEITQMDYDHTPVESVAISPDGKYIVSRTVFSIASVLEVTTGKEVARIIHDGNIKDISFSPNGKYVVTGSRDNTARVWEVKTGKEFARITHDGEVYSVAFSPDGKYVVSGGSDKTARVWESSTGIELARMNHASIVLHVAFSPGGKYIATGSDDGVIHIWETFTGKEFLNIRYYFFTNNIVFSPDGKYIAAGSGEYTARVWEVTTGKEIARLPYDSSVNAVAFSPDGKYVIAGSTDNSARVWEISTGKEIARMLHNGSVSSVAFSPDGKYVASGGWDSTVRIWMWQPQDLISKACEYLPRNLTRVEWQQYIGDALPYQAVCDNLPIEQEPMPTSVSTPLQP